MKKKTIDLIIYIFLLFTPVLDFITGICSWHNMFSIGIFFRSIFLIYVMYYLIFKVRDKHTYFILGLLAIYSFFFLIFHRNYLVSNLTYLVRVFYLPLLICFFKSYKNSYLTKNVYVYLLVGYMVLYLLPYIFGLGHNINEFYPNKDLYLSYFYVGNELVNVFLLLFIMNVDYFIKTKKKYFVVILVLFLMCIYLLGTKVMYVGLLITILYFVYVYRKYLLECLKTNKWLYGVLIVLVFSVLLIIPRTSFYKNIKTTLEYYNVTNIKDILNYEKINQVIFSNRLSFLENVHNIYGSSNISNKLFGIGREVLIVNKDVEIDIFDIYYVLGVIGFIVYIVVICYSLKFKNLDKSVMFSIVLLIIISFFSGHVLASPMVSGILGMGSYFKEGGSHEDLDKKSI